MKVASIWMFAGFAVAVSTFAQQRSMQSWTLLNSLDGGAVLDVVSGDGALVALTARHNAFRSLDSGKTWQPFPIGQGYARSIFYDGTAKLFYGIGDDGLVRVAEPAAQSWRTFVDAGGNSVYSSGKFSADGPTLINYPMRDTGILVSRDGGKTWRQSVNRVTGINPLGVLAADGCVYAGDMDYPISVSCDGGATWKSGGGDTWKEGDGRFLSNYAYSMVRDGDAVLAVATGGILRSLDRGATWRLWEGNLKTFDRVWHIWRSGAGLYVWDKDGVTYRSWDRGRTWSALAPTPAYTGSWPSEILAQAGDSWFAATNRGLYASLDSGKTWAPHPFGLMQSPILALGINGQRYLVQTDAGIFHSRDSGASWRPSLPGDSATGWRVFGGAGGRYAAGTGEGIVRVTLDMGETWSPARSLPGGALTGLGFVGATCYAGTPQGLFSSADPGGNWTPVPMPVAEIPRILVSDGRSLLIGADSRVWELDADGSFADRTAGLAPLQVQGLWSTGAERFALTRDGGLYRWHTSGSPSASPSGPGWRRMSGIEGIPFAVAGSGPSIVLATSTGTYASLDGGGTWKATNAISLRGEQIRTLAFDGAFAYGGDGHGGLWRMYPEFPKPPVALYPERRKKTVHPIRGPQSALSEAGRRLDGRFLP